MVGAAAIILREMPIGMLVNGDDVDDGNGQMVHYSGVGMILRALEKRYGALDEEVAVHSISELMGFARQPNESTDEVLARFEVLLHRAGAVAGVQFGPQLRAWMLLNHLRIPKTAWHIILSPTLGRLPATVDEFANFSQYVRRNGHLHEKSGDDQKNMGRPYFAAETDQSYPSYLANHPESQSSDHWLWPTDASSHAYPAYPNSERDADAISWHSYSTGKSDQDEPIDWSNFDDQIPEPFIGESLYLAFRAAKRRWRSFAGASRGRFKGRGKGKGKGKGKNSGTSVRSFWVDDLGHNHYIDPSSNHPYDAVDFHQPVYFKGKGKGKSTNRSGNPIGKDGKPMLCSICESDQHFRARCPKGDGKGGKKGGGGKAAFFEQPQPTPIAAVEPAGFNWGRPAYFNPGFLEDAPPPAGPLTSITFSDGSEPILLASSPPENQLALLYDANSPTHSFPPPYYPVWSAFHAKVRLAKGEALLIDTGAVGNLSGDAQMLRFEALGKANGHGSLFEVLPKRLNIDGVGKEASKCTRTGIVPLVLSDGRLASYRAPMIDESPVPALLGLTSMTDHRVILDLINNKYIMIGPGGYELKLSPGSNVLDMERAPTGHLMLPASEWHKCKPGAKTVALTAVVTH